MDVSTQGFGFGIGFDPYPHLSGVAPHHADNRRTVIGIGASSTTLVGSTARWVSRVKVRAQVGGKEGGTLALFHDQNMHQESLLSSWRSIFEPLTRGAIKDNLITTGRYRTMEIG